MNDLNKKTIAGLLNLFVVVGAVLFLSAWSVSYWQGWIFLATFFLPCLAITLYLMRHDPRLLERRVHAGAIAEKETVQKVIQAFAGLGFLATIAVPGFDRRFGWSAVPVPVVAAGNALVLVGFLLVFLVFRVNTFTSGVIEVSGDQKVISTGLYSVVRHPMYAGALAMLFGVPLALGSYWGLLAFLPMTLAIVIRLLKEERFLVKNLIGYSDYCKTVKYRLAPLIW